MRFWTKVRKGAGKKGLEPAQKIAKAGRADDLIRRITELQEAGADVVIRERRLGGTGVESSGFVGSTPIANVEPMNYLDDVGRRHGGGTYRWTLMSRGRTLMDGGDEGAPEIYMDQIAGPPKTEKKEKTESQPTAKNQQMNQTEMMHSMLELIVKVKDVFINPAPDPAAQMESLATAWTRMSGIFGGPTITTGPQQASRNSLVRDIVEGATAGLRPMIQPKIDALERHLMQPGPPGASATPGAALPVSGGQRPGAEVMETPAQEAKLPTIDGLGQLRHMVQGGVDARTAGEYAARVIEAFVDLSAPEGVLPQWREYLTNPTLAVSVLPQIIPEVPARGAEYQEEFLARAVEVFKTWAQQLSEDESNAVQSDDTEDKDPERQPEEPSEGGGQSEGTGVDAGHDPEGALD